jgi:hypothetical protein
LFQLGLPTETAQFKGRWQTLAQGEKNGWQVRVSFLPTPYGIAEFSARQVPRTELTPADVVAEMPLFGIPSDRTSPWVWLGVDDFRNQATAPRYSAEVIEKMMASVQCDAARP